MKHKQDHPPVESDAQVHKIYHGKTLTGKKNLANIFLISEYHPTMLMTCLGMPLAKTSEGEGNIPRART